MGLLVIVNTAFMTDLQLLCLSERHSLLKNFSLRMIVIVRKLWPTFPVLPENAS